MKNRSLALIAVAYAATLPVMYSSPMRFKSVKSKPIFIDEERISKAEVKRQRKAAKRLK